MHENLYLNHVVPECQITNKVNKAFNKAFKKLPQIIINFSYLCSFVVRKLMRKTDKTDENKHDELSQSLSSAAPNSCKLRNLQQIGKSLDLNSKFEIYL